MNMVLKRVRIAWALVVVCTIILVASKSYGIWVITGFAFFLYILGLVIKEKGPNKTGEARDDRRNDEEPR
jgi:uncharacterized membrane protein YhaH (DUF805 family)